MGCAEKVLSLQSLPKVMEHLRYFCCLLSSIPLPRQNNVVVNRVDRHRNCRSAWRLVSGKYTLNSAFLLGGGDFSRSTQIRNLF